MRKKDDVNWALVILMFILGWVLSPYIVQFFNSLK